MSAECDPSESIEPLRLRLSQPLPGRAAQCLAAPSLAYGRHFGPVPQEARAAAVLVLLYPHQGQLHLPLVLRPETLAAHAGQVSLPGGVVEPGEANSAAALRELEEELGVPSNRVTLLGPLSPLYLYVTRFDIAPWIGWCPTRPEFRPAPEEVALLLELPLAQLLEPQRWTSHLRQMHGIRWSVPHFDIPGHPVWGATAMILSELRAIWSDRSSWAASAPTSPQR